ncbi:salicylic acid-binding protein 2-like [Solanum tuberosum]|uniref:Methylketone synthase I n=1 Tax=Solanum tuberosum TaxID=4113 RepID=M1CG09_SOLTU|nr:PREDICTED: salicylic acid-binding protein 2-like [Solanum tuberosum]
MEPGAGTRLMTSSGHNVTALDLGASGINPKQALEIPIFSDYLTEFMASLRDLALATILVRPYHLYHVEDVAKEILLSSKRYGSVRRVFIVAAENEALKKEFSQLMIEKNPPDEVEEIQGSDHVIMMSKPQRFFTTLLSIANKYIFILLPSYDDSQ